MSSDLAFALRGVGTAVGGNFALRDVSFELPTGYVMGLIGANGAGKTTTIRCLLGMRAIETGEIELLGHRVPGPVALRQDVGVVLDHTYLVGDWRLAEVERTLRPFYDRWDGVRYRQLLDEFGLDLRAKVKDLSRGMAMKLMIAVALSHQARLLVFDEPTSGLDPVTRDELVGIIGDFLLDEGHSVLFSTHITSDLDRIGDYLTLIHERPHRQDRHQRRDPGGLPGRARRPGRPERTRRRPADRPPADADRDAGTRTHRGSRPSRRGRARRGTHP